MLWFVFISLCVLADVEGRRHFHHHKRNSAGHAHRRDKTHTIRSLVTRFTSPTNVSLESKSCIYEGEIRRHGEAWSPGPCVPECHCSNGYVKCSNLECPDLNCAHSIKKKWKCCPECPPESQNDGGSCGVRTEKGNANSSCCLFPFKFQDVMYYTCTYMHHNKPWCAVTKDFDKDGVWGDCIDGDDVNDDDKESPIPETVANIIAFQKKKGDEARQKAKQNSPENVTTKADNTTGSSSTVNGTKADNTTGSSNTENGTTKADNTKGSSSTVDVTKAGSTTGSSNTENGTSKADNTTGTSSTNNETTKADNKTGTSNTENGTTKADNTMAASNTAPANASNTTDIPSTSNSTTNHTLPSNETVFPGATPIGGSTTNIEKAKLNTNLPLNCSSNVDAQVLPVISNAVAEVMMTFTQSWPTMSYNVNPLPSQQVVAPSALATPFALPSVNPSGQIIGPSAIPASKVNPVPSQPMAAPPAAPPAAPLSQQVDAPSPVTIVNPAPFQQVVAPSAVPGLNPSPSRQITGASATPVPNVSPLPSQQMVAPSPSVVPGANPSPTRQLVSPLATAAAVPGVVAYNRSVMTAPLSSVPQAASSLAEEENPMSYIAADMPTFQTITVPLLHGGFSVPPDPLGEGRQVPAQGSGKTQNAPQSGNGLSTNAESPLIPGQKNDPKLTLNLPAGAPPLESIPDTPKQPGAPKIKVLPGREVPAPLQAAREAEEALLEKEEAKHAQSVSPIPVAPAGLPAQAAGPEQAAAPTARGTPVNIPLPQGSSGVPVIHKGGTISDWTNVTALPVIIGKPPFVWPNLTAPCGNVNSQTGGCVYPGNPPPVPCGNSIQTVGCVYPTTPQPTTPWVWPNATAPPITTLPPTITNVTKAPVVNFTATPTPYVWFNITESPLVENKTTLPPVWANMTAPITATPFVWPNMTAPTTASPLVWANMTAPTTASPVVWANMTAPTKATPLVWVNMTGPSFNTSRALILQSYQDQKDTNELSLLSQFAPVKGPTGYGPNSTNGTEDEPLSNVTKGDQLTSDNRTGQQYGRAQTPYQSASDTGSVTTANGGAATAYGSPARASTYGAFAPTQATETSSYAASYPSPAPAPAPDQATASSYIAPYPSPAPAPAPADAPAPSYTAPYPSPAPAPDQATASSYTAPYPSPAPAPAATNSSPVPDSIEIPTEPSDPYQASYNDAATVGSDVAGRYDSTDPNEAQSKFVKMAWKQAEDYNEYLQNFYAKASNGEG